MVEYLDVGSNYVARIILPSGDSPLLKNRSVEETSRVPQDRSVFDKGVEKIEKEHKNDRTSSRPDNYSFIREVRYWGTTYTFLGEKGKIFIVDVLREVNAESRQPESELVIGVSVKAKDMRDITSFFQE